MNKICELVSALGKCPLEIRFYFPCDASLNEIEYARSIVNIQIDTWETWNKKRIYDAAFHNEFVRAMTGWQNDGGI